MPSEGGTETDAVHIRFREKGPLTNFYCYDCANNFQSSSILDVFHHYGQTEHIHFHCDCLYCKGKVYQYRDGSQNIQYFHNCLRWKRQIEK